MATATVTQLLPTTGMQVHRTGTLANIRLSAYAGWASLTITHGQGQPESTVSVPLADAQGLVIGQSLAVMVA